MFYKLCPLILAALLIACNSRRNSEIRADSRGKQLSETYCKSCHLYTQPELLDRSSWVKVLASMEREMEKASMSLEHADWVEIQQYYLENSPPILSPLASKKKIQKSTLFQRTGLLDSVEGATPFVTKVQYDRESNVLRVGDNYGTVFEFDRLEFKGRFSIADTPVDFGVDKADNSLDVLGIGSFMPSDAKNGSLIKVEKGGNQRTLIDSLERPVHFTREDFNGDGAMEYLISCFGSTTGNVNSGKLSLFQLEDQAYHETVVKSIPGAIKSVTGDFNNDQRPDIIALFAQGREVISMFLNRGGFDFEEKQLLEFNPLYGCNSFELVDINHDSFPDIVLTNGDNGDSSPVFKFYHGVRVFVNDGNYGFKEKYFYPVNGASQVLIRDFDNDHDLDMVVLAMFPDLFSWSEETIVFFENKGDLNFEPSYIEEEPAGKWFLMDAGDVDDDGDEDLILGTNYKVKPVLLPPRFRQEWDKGQISYAVFINNTVK